MCEALPFDLLLLRPVSLQKTEAGPNELPILFQTVIRNRESLFAPAAYGFRTISLAKYFYA
jgi:hypothetical protein